MAFTGGMGAMSPGALSGRSLGGAGLGSGAAPAIGGIFSDAINNRYSNYTPGIDLIPDLLAPVSSMPSGINNSAMGPWLEGSTGDFSGQPELKGEEKSARAPMPPLPVSRSFYQDISNSYPAPRIFTPQMGMQDVPFQPISFIQSPGIRDNVIPIMAEYLFGPQGRYWG